MNNIQLNIIANAQFQQVFAEVARLKEAMLSLQKTSVGGPFTPQVTASIRQAQAAFDSAVLSTRAFTVEHVAMSSSVEKFGKHLQSGQLSLSNYYKIWRESAKGVSAELDALATTQARLNRSVAIADPLRPGYAKLVTDINGVVTAQEKATFYQRALNTALQQGSIKLIDFGKNTQWMGRQLTVGLTMPLAMFGAGASSVFLNLDKELTRMQKVYGTGLLQPTQATLKQIRSEIIALGQDLARTLGTSMQETAAMSADLAATGLEGAKLIGATRQAIRLATLGELDHQQAMQATISLQNVYKLNTQGLTTAVNFLNAVENQTSTSLQDLVDAIPRVGPVVQQLGGSFKDTAAMMVAMKEAGVPAAQGANAIKSSLASLINPSKNAQQAFQAFNIDLRKIASETGGAPIMMFKALADQMKNLDRLAQAQLIEKLFGKYQFSRIQALLDNINRAGSQTATVFQLMGASSAELASLADKELKTQTESASGRFKRMVETLKADIVPLGNMFLTAFTKIGNFIDKIITGIRTLGNILGPVAKMFGNVFGVGLAGAVIIGPIIMLVGLFANLVGNILRSANAIRMFRQGMEQAGASENKFLAGLHGMRNFYQDLDKSAIAARSQLELMPNAITSNATAFDILRRSIYDLTLQFQALATAQAEAMGMNIVATGRPKGGVFKIPFSDVPKMATGGFVPGVGNYDTQPAMLTPGEFVVNKYAAQKYSPFLNAINGGNTLGGSVTQGRTNYGIKVPASMVNAVAESLGLRTRSNVAGRNYQLKGSLGAVLGEDFTAINAAMAVPENKLLMAARGQVGVDPQRYLQSFAAGGSKTSYGSFLQAIHQAGVITQEELKKLLQEFTSEYTKSVSQLNKINDVNNPLAQVAKKQVEALGKPEVSNLYQQFEKSATSFVPDVMTEEQRAAAGLPPSRKREGGGRSGRSGAVKGVTLYTSSGMPVKIGAEEFKVSGGGRSQGFAHTESTKLREMVARGSADQKAYEEGKQQEALKNKEAKDPYRQTRSSKRRSPHPDARKDGADDARAYSESTTTTLEQTAPSQSRMDRIASKYSIAGRLSSSGGKLGKIGGALGNFRGMGPGFGAMIASSAVNMMPNKIAGADISGAKGAASSVLGTVGMAAMIPGVNLFLPEIAAAATVFQGIKWAFQRADRERKKFEDGVRETYKKLESTPDKFINKIEKQITNNDRLATSYDKLSIHGKVYSDYLYKTVKSIQEGTLKGDALAQALKVVGTDSGNAATKMKLLADAAKKAGDADFSKLITQLTAVYGASTNALNALNTYNQMVALGVKINPSYVGDKAAVKAAFEARIKELQGSNGGGNGPVDKQIKALDERLKKEEAIKKNLENQLKAMQEQAKVIDRQNEYLNRQTNLTQQIKEAETKGEYITAASLRALQTQETAKLNREKAQDVLQGKIDAQQKVIDAINAQSQELQKIAAATAATAANTGLINQLIALEQAILNKLPGLYNPLGGPKDLSNYAGEGTKAVDTAKRTKEQQTQAGAKQYVTAVELRKAGVKPKATIGPNGERVDSFTGTYYVDSKGNKYSVGLELGYGTGNYKVTKLAIGGPVLGAGTWTSDSIPAMLSHGEFVMNASAVNKYGLGTMYALNNKMYNVPGSNSSLPAGNAGSQTINFYINGTTDPQAVANIVMSKLKTVNAKTNKSNMVIR